jgi:deoxyribodipyrimidine photo-lyase
MAPSDILAEADVRLGENYPAPIVDHAAARDRALAALAEIRD